MAFVPVPKDLTKVKTKIALNLTKRQLICFSIAGAVGIPFYLFTKSYIGADISAILMVTIMLPFFFFAMYEKDGQPFERILKNMIRTKYLWPSKRPYQTENMYAVLEKQAKFNKSAQIPKSTLKRKQRPQQKRKRLR